MLTKAIRTAVPIVLWLFLLFPAAAIAGGWGSGATLTPGWDHLRDSMVKAFQHPMTWGPAVAGFATIASGRDGDLARSLYTETPVFGSVERADQESDRYRQIADTLWMVSIVATDSGEDPLRNKVKGALVQVGAVNLTYLRTNTAKSVVDRDEPMPAEGESFPSNHATGAFAHATLIRENMKATSLPPAMAWGYTIAGYVAATGSAWGRIEAGGHHVSDQLLSAALANFTALFINTAFMGDSASIAVQARQDESYLAVTVPF